VFNLCNLQRLIAFYVVVTTVFLSQVLPVASATLAGTPAFITAAYTVVLANIDNLQ
jgi:hypothetical protein